MDTDIIARGMAGAAKKGGAVTKEKVVGALGYTPTYVDDESNGSSESTYSSEKIIEKISEVESWTGTKAEWEALDKSTLVDGQQINITDDEETVLTNADVEKFTADLNVAVEKAENEANIATEKATNATTAAGKAEAAQTATQAIAESIPADYSELSNDVSGLKEDLHELDSGLSESITDIEINGFIDSIPPLSQYYKKDSVATISNTTVRLDGSAWGGGVWYKLSVSEMTDYVFNFNITRNSGVAVIQIKASDESSNIVNEPVSPENKKIEFNSAENRTIYLRLTIGAVACENFVFSDMSVKKEKNKIAEIEDEIAQLSTPKMERKNLIDLNNPFDKTDGSTIVGNSVVLNGKAWVGYAVFETKVNKNTDYVLRYKITKTSGVSGIDIASTPNGSDIKANINQESRSALTFNSGNNETVYIRFRITNVDCVNFAYNNVRLNAVDDLIDIQIKKMGFKKTIICWGDSLTAGAGASDSIVIDGLKGATMPKALAHLLGYSIPTEKTAFDGNEDDAVINFGVGGENSATILCRMGAMQMVVNNITIPSSGSVTFSEIYCTDGQRVYPLHQNWSGSIWTFETCYIGGVEGTLTYSGAEVETETSKGTYTFTRKESGSPVAIDRPTAIISPIHKRYGDILILQIGHNGGWNNDYETLVNQYRMAIEKGQTKRYIIIGMTSGTAETNKEWEHALQTAFQRHYINMREYLTHPIYNESGEIVNCYGLADRGFTPTTDDLEKIAVGEVPLQLKVDSAHFTSYGYYTEAEQVYKRGKELGYWN